MRKPLFLLALLVSTAAPAEILERAPFPPPDYASIPQAGMYAPKDEYATAAADRRFRLEKVAYRSGGLSVYAYLYAPVQRSGKMPAVIFNRGSFVRPEFAGELLAAFRRLAESGFAVIAPMYRQSGGGEGKDEMGGADLEDLMSTASLAKELGFIDTENLFMYGESRGGMMTYQAIRDGFPLRAAAVYGAFTDLGTFLDSSLQAKALAPRIWPDYESKKEEIHRRRSAVAWAEKLGAPILIMHGGNDTSVSPAQALALAAKLQSLGKSYELIIRAGSNHVLTDWRIERDKQAVEWFRRHSTGASVAAPTRSTGVEVPATSR